MTRKFGVMCDSQFIKEWQYRSIEYILEKTNYSLELVILNSNKKQYKINSKNILYYLTKFLIIKTKQTRRRNIAELNAKCDNVYCNTVQRGTYSKYFYDDDIEKIKSYELDFILRFGFGIIRGRILNVCKYGIWSFHHGDEKKYRGETYCFWEIYNNDFVTGSILQILTDKLDGGKVLKKGYFKTQLHSYSKNIEQALELSSLWPSQICIEIINGTYRDKDQSTTNGRIYKAPTNSQMLKFCILLIRNKFRNIYSKYFTFDQWHVGYIRKNIQDVLLNKIDIKEIVWLSNKSNSRFIADPFLFSCGQKTILAVESLPYNTCKGEIEVYNKFLNSIEKKEEFSLIEPFHLSYPNIFKICDSLYCLPEAYSSNQLRLYEYKNKVWNKHVLIDNIRAIDPEIILYEGYYWLFFTMKNNFHDTLLYLYYSTNIFDNWCPHPLNPVIFDIRRARGAGKIQDINGSLIRFGQNYSRHKEGSISICRINKLNKLEYEEEILSEIKPLVHSFYPDKIHTINGVGNITVFDAAKIRNFLFSPGYFFSSVKHKFHESKG
jgi:methionyl-tRNA formyltransferase